MKDSPDLIFGAHSIAHALANPERGEKTLYLTQKGRDDLVKRSGLNIQLEAARLVVLTPHEFQQKIKQLCDELDLEYRRVPTGAFLVVGALPDKDVSWIYERVERGEKLKLLALDRVTDGHNAAAILRTAAFFGVHALVVAQKGSFTLGPGAFRVTSGAYEHVPIIRTANLPRFIDRLQELGFPCLGLSEHADRPISLSFPDGVCLVLGAEDEGLSHAVMRNLKETFGLRSQGSISSLNVSVAAAVAMEKIFGQKG